MDFKPLPSRLSHLLGGRVCAYFHVNFAVCMCITWVCNVIGRYREQQGQKGVTQGRIRGLDQVLSSALLWLGRYGKKWDNGVVGKVKVTPFTLCPGEMFPYFLPTSPPSQGRVALIRRKTTLRLGELVNSSYLHLSAIEICIDGPLLWDFLLPAPPSHPFTNPLGG